MGRPAIGAALRGRGSNTTAPVDAPIRTRVTDMFGIDHPIVLGGLQGLGRAELAAAVSEAGGLGLVTAGCFATAEEFAAEITRIRSLTDRPFGVNVALSARRSMGPHLEAACTSGVPIVFTSGNDPSHLVPIMKAHGITWIHVAPAIRYARKAVELGADGLVVVGFEAGGHPGLDDVALSVLVRLAVRSFEVPVIAAGGINDGPSMLAALSWGAEGVQIGTRFVMSRQSPLHEQVKQALVAADERSTLVIERSMRKARRVLRTERAEEVLRLEGEGASFEEMRHIIGGESYLRTILEGDLAAGVLSTGQNVALMRDVPDAREIVQDIIEEAAVTLGRLNRWFSTDGVQSAKLFSLTDE